MQRTLPNQENNLWQALKDLDFLSAFFSWFFMLLTRLSEPLMLLSTLYVVAEAGVPSIALPSLHNLAVGIMITAPEIILPGSFVVASRPQQQHARWLFTVCWTFVLLTLITLISLFVWHFTGQALAWLMCARCAAAVGYSILMRVMNHGQRVNQVQTVPVPDVQVFVQEICENIEHLQRGNIEQVQRIHASTERRIADQLQRTFTELRGQYQRTEQVQKPALFERILFSEQTAIHSQIVPVLEGNSSFEFVEFGAACMPDEVAPEVDGEVESSPQFPSQIAPTLTLLPPPKETAKGPYFMDYEEAAEYTGLSIRTLKIKVSSGEIEKSNSGKLKVKSLEKFRRKSV